MKSVWLIYKGFPGSERNPHVIGVVDYGCDLEKEIPKFAELEIVKFDKSEWSVSAFRMGQIYYWRKPFSGVSDEIYFMAVYHEVHEGEQS